jgi:chlorite dismutase
MTETTQVVQSEESSTSWFTTYTVFARKDDAPAKSDAEAATDNAEFTKLIDTLADQGVTVRGLYDVSGMRAEADIMVWMWSKSPEVLQDAIRQIRRSGLLSGTKMVFTAMGADRMAEFNPEHVPAFTEGRKPRKWLCFYPFVRSYDWYTLDPKERARMLRDHGKLGQEFPDVWANTVSAFGLNDWEWLLGLESPRLDLLVDMMRSLRNNETRHYVREEVPFYTGRYIEVDEVAEVLA